MQSLAQSDFSEADIKNRLNNLLQTLQVKPGLLFAALRIATTGSKNTPELFGTLAVIGKEKTTARLQKTLDNLLK